VHGKNIYLCTNCGGNGICGHGRDKRRCNECAHIDAVAAAALDALYEVKKLMAELADLAAELKALVADTRENISHMDKLEASIQEKTSLLAEKNLAIDRAKVTEAARVEKAKDASEARESMHRVGLALVTAAALGPGHIYRELAKLGHEVGQLTLSVAQRLVTMCALSGEMQKDYRDQFIKPLTRRKEEASQLISALQGALAQHGPLAGSDQSSSSRTDTDTDTCIAVDCDHPREQHVPVGDKRCDGCGWHQSATAMFLCTSCVVSVCKDCHGVLNARQARKRSLQCARLIVAVARGFLARRRARRQMDGAGATMQMQTNENQTTPDSEP
jgi:hypothetical protein